MRHLCRLPQGSGNVVEEGCGKNVSWRVGESALSCLLVVTGPSYLWAHSSYGYLRKIKSVNSPSAEGVGLTHEEPPLPGWGRNTKVEEWRFAGVQEEWKEVMIKVHCI